MSAVPAILWCIVLIETQLYDAKPPSEMLQLWKDNAVFEEPLTKAQGRDENEAHWVQHLNPLQL